MTIVMSPPPSGDYVIESIALIWASCIFIWLLFSYLNTLYIEWFGVVSGTCAKKTCV